MIPGRLRIIAVWLVGLLVCAAIIVNTRFSTDMSAFLPRSPNPAQQILVDQLRAGVVSRQLLLAIAGGDPNTLAALSKAVAHDLRAAPGIGIVNNGEADNFARDRDVLWRNRYLLSANVTAEHYTPAALHADLEADLSLLNSDLGLLAARTIPADPTGEMVHLLDGLAFGSRPEMFDGVWMSPDHSRALLMVQTLAPGFDLNGQEQAIDRIEVVFAAARKDIAAAGQAQLLESGPPLFAVQTRAHMIQDVSRLSMIAMGLVAAILLLAYRSARVLVLALLPVLSGIIVGIAGVSLGFGFVHGITLGFGVTLIGEAVDYAIYLFTQTEFGAAPAATLRRIGPTLRLGMLTSVCGFSTMLFSSFIGFAQLGLFTIVGLLVALTVTRFVLPALLPRQSPFRGATVFAVPLLALMRQARAARFVMAALTLVAAIALVLHKGRYWENELASMSPLSAAQKSLDDQLRRETGAPDVRYLLVVEAADQQHALMASEAVAERLKPLAAAGTISDFDYPGRWLPSEAMQKARQAALPAAATLAANLAQAVAGTAFRPDSFAPFLADVAAASRQPLLQRSDLDGTSLALRLDSLLLQGRHGWTALLPLQGVTQPDALAATIAGFKQPSLLFLDLRAESDRLLAAYLHEALTLSLVGCLVIVGLLSVTLRSPGRIAAVCLPLGAAVICTAAALLTGNGVLSIFNLFGLLLVVAVGSNYCLFFERSEPDDPVRERMVASLLLANLCTVIGFGILSFSRFPVLHGIGSTVAIGAVLCLVFGAVLNEPSASLRRGK
ncbi:MAG: MMPL family transporter [Acetobacteraceae bacterium]|jgi:predicted exporter